MTRLYQYLSKALAADKSVVAVKEVARVRVCDNPSDTPYPHFYHARIGGMWAKSIFTLVCIRG